MIVPNRCGIRHAERLPKSERLSGAKCFDIRSEPNYGNSSMRTVQGWLLPLSLLLLSVSFSNGKNGNVLPTIENDVLRISLSPSDASLTVVDKRITLEWRQQVRPGFRVEPDSIRVSQTSLSAKVLGEGATYVLTISLTKESQYAFDLVLDIPDQHSAAMPASPFPSV